MPNDNYQKASEFKEELQSDPRVILLNKLDKEMNEKGKSFEKEGIKSIVESLKKNNTITELDLIGKDKSLKINE